VRRELAETVAALQQRRLLTEAREYTLTIKVLGQLGAAAASNGWVMVGDCGWFRNPAPG